jgi:hypothetical protein
MGDRGTFELSPVLLRDPSTSTRIRSGFTIIVTGVE